MGLMMPAFLGVAASILAIIGIARRHGLTYRFGIAFGPIGAAWTLVGALTGLRHLDTNLMVTIGAVALLGIATPILWTRRGVKCFFGLRCPECGEFRIGAESFTFFERRCLTCNTVFRADGTILRSARGSIRPSAASWPSQPLAAGSPGAGGQIAAAAQGVSDTPQQVIAATPPTSPGSLGGIPVQSYAGSPSLFSGPPGVERKTIWYIVCAAIVVFMSLLALLIEFNQARQNLAGSPSGQTSPQPLAIAVTILHLLGLIALLIYWVVWVGIIHGEMRRFTGYGYRVSPAKAVGFCFIPFLNLYWVVYMPYEMARTLPRYLGNRRGSDRSASVLVFQLLALVLGFFVPGLRVLFVGLAMHAIQSVLNDLWRTVRDNTPVGPTLEPAPVSTDAGRSGVPAIAAGQTAPFLPIAPAMPACAPRIEEDAAMRMLLPVGRSGWAVAAGYLGLLSPLLVPAPFAVITAIIAIREMRRHPEKHGMGRAVFGLALGIPCTLVTVAVLVMAISQL